MLIESLIALLRFGTPVDGATPPFYTQYYCFSGGVWREIKPESGIDILLQWILTGEDDADS